MPTPAAPARGAERLNVIALVSGGKDSFFSLLHCMANGHRVVALANLYPARAAPGTAPDGGATGGSATSSPATTVLLPASSGRRSFLTESGGGATVRDQHLPRAPAACADEFCGLDSQGWRVVAVLMRIQEWVAGLVRRAVRLYSRRSAAWRAYRLVRHIAMTFMPIDACRRRGS